MKQSQDLQKNSEHCLKELEMSIKGMSESLKLSIEANENGDPDAVIACIEKSKTHFRDILDWHSEIIGNAEMLNEIVNEIVELGWVTPQIFQNDIDIVNHFAELASSMLTSVKDMQTAFELTIAQVVEH
jgi:hypothetical protein